MNLKRIIKKTTTILHFTKLLLTNTGEVLNTILLFTERIKKRNYVQQKLNFPKGLPTLDLLEIFPNFNETIKDYTYLEGTSFVTDIALLKALGSKFKEGDYLEIGSLRGESLVNISEVMKNCISLTMSDEEMREINSPENYIKSGRMFSANLPNVQHVFHNSLTFDFQKLNKKFDLIFVDGDHTYEGVRKDTENVFKLLKNENSIIVWHDYALYFETIRWEVLAAILDGTPDAERKHLYHISNTICAVYMKGNFNTCFPKYPIIPNKTFKVSVVAEKIKK